MFSIFGDYILNYGECSSQGLCDLFFFYYKAYSLMKNSLSLVVVGGNDIIVNFLCWFQLCLIVAIFWLSGIIIWTIWELSMDTITVNILRLHEYIKAATGDYRTTQNYLSSKLTTHLLASKLPTSKTAERVSGFPFKICKEKYQYQKACSSSHH